LDHGEIARDAVRTHVEWIRFPRFAVCGGVSFEGRIIEFGVIRHQGSRTVLSGGLRHLLGGSDIFFPFENVCSLSPHKLEAARFATARLIGKLANICPDLLNERLATTSTFKAITGGDPIMAEYKYGDSFDLWPSTRLVFSAKRASEKPGAVLRRNESSMIPR